MLPEKQPLCLLSEASIDLQALLDFVSDPGHGAQCFFSGRIRDNSGGRRVSAVFYDAFPPLALRVFKAIAREAQEGWGARAAIAHRLGTLPVGEISVIVAASAGHRKESFEACRHLIEEVKKRAPIWKKEIYADGKSAWLEGCEISSASPERLFSCAPPAGAGPAH